MRKYLTRLTKIEKIAVAFLSLVVLISATQIGQAFYLENSDITPIEGGVYIEGAAGKIGLLNPLYVPYGSITHDLTQLIFSGLSKYDPKKRDVVPDLADYTVSDDGREYTFVIKEGVTWHDGMEVTSDDVVFTYETVIRNPLFSGQILNYNDYTGMKVVKVDDQTVQFLLEEPDSFFLVKTIVGLLPEHLLGHAAVETLDTELFNQFPIGTGPYQFISMTPQNDSLEVTLETYENYYGAMPNIGTIQVQVYPDEKSLLKHLGELDGMRNVSSEALEKVRKSHLNLVRYELPQYVAVFMNTQSAALKSDNVRLALQLGTDKETIMETLGQSQIIDTPLLEIDQSNWVHQYSVSKANGALFETQWQLPSKQEVEEEEVEEAEEPEENEDDSDEPGYINGPNSGKDWQTTDKKVVVTGTVPEKTKGVVVNDYQLQKFVPGDDSWSYVASFEFRNLKSGINVFDVYAIDFDDKKTLIDSITVVQGTVEKLDQDNREKTEKENEAAEKLPVRINLQGEELSLNLIAPKQPEAYAQVATMLKGQWAKLGIDLTVDVLDSDVFQDRLFKRDYDLLIFGQNLGYNLDAYPYWHSSQAKEGGYNLSQFKNFAVDSLLDKAREERDAEDRKKTLNDIQEIISKEVPAIFLYSPTYYFALSDDIQNTFFENLATASDRFASIQDWYGKVDRQLNSGVNPLTFASWFLKQF